PATLLHLDQHMGSIKVGKDADVVLWSDNPTSVYARVEKTIVDGKLLYDAQDDIKLRDEMHRDRARIIQEMIAEKNGGAPVRLPKVHHLHLWTCDDLITDGSYLSEQ
ncbi:MAG TPA: amidohydrolase family protein, partial [Bacteroidia bacterium]|nr:amidohydrolase family protein [Bacteroidia bacterium]